MKRAEKELTNYFTGQPKQNNKMSLATSISDKFQFSIVNENAAAAKRVAIFTGNIRSKGTDCKSANYSTAATAALAAEGYIVDSVLCDATDSNVSMRSVDSSKSIAHVMEYFRYNQRYVKKVTIASNNVAAYNTSMSMCSLNPFHKEAERDIDLNQYYKTSQYQNDKIEIEYTEGELQINDCLFWAINVPSSTTLQITIEFYNE